ncbi:transport and Golgi organization protein 11-like [Varroa jacobsoni]|uniref:Mitochondrial fission factor n=1 Tax=Varroa destructor TaxID=109461 RepID=A0A7M7K376_VARDE|nr:transport and Golgi organization protein 11-like [Varroa destructor]XP_022654933.1 transport and Golgi organization protein 11-like [Varroa destructor]XP_022654934.1 transport and Golgi organization protein 11-like [Varroa destructor]XP_022654935.1 transport and Golgi organization protein 11-like [Varroa destructor]XP_022694178.1 transport and Golgi organization protein 11-like [Varroa jacobsoni]XP_022694179.1 transport and Golgi organization protein 11-like [Varroa jacobsoni]XP_022694180.
MESSAHNGISSEGVGNGTGQEYDSNFTQEISNKMRVPQRISVVDPDYAMKPVETIGEPHLQRPEKSLVMTVPDRILIGEGGRHVPGRDPLPEAKFERNVLDFQEPIQLEAPPRTLTLDQHKFPSLGENASGNQKKVKFEESVNNLSSLDDLEDEKLNSSLVGTPPGDISRDDISSLQKQLRDTRRRLSVLEAENRERQQREVAFCSFALFYFVLKGVLWMNRNW